MPSKSLLLSVLAAGLCLVVSASAVRAQKRIVVLEIEGSRTGDLRESLTRLIRPNKSLNDNTYRNAARRLRAPKLNPKSVARVARYLEADGVLDGTLVAKDGDYKFTVRLRSGRTGAIVSTIPMTLSKPRLSDKMQRGLRTRLIDAIDELPLLDGGGEGGGFDDEGDEGFDESKEGFGDSKDPGKGNDGKRDKRGNVDDDAERGDDDDDAERGDDDDDAERGDDDDAERGDDDDDDDDNDNDGRDDDDVDDDDFGDVKGPANAWQDPRRRQFLVMAGLSLAKRTLTFSVAQGLENPPPGYKSGNVPGAYINGIIFPLMKKQSDKKESPTENVGITFMYDRVLQIDTKVDDGTGMIVPVGTTAERWAIGAAYRMLFGKGPMQPSLTFLAAYNRNKFVIDKAMSPVAIDVPNTEYVWIDPGARFRMGVTKEAAVFAEAHFLLVLDTGEMQELDQYGAAKVTGFDADVGGEYWITPRYLVRAGGRYTRLGYAYEGNGALNDRNGDNEVDVGGALDAYLGGYVTVGAAF